MATELMLPGSYSQTVQNAKSHVTPSLAWCHHSFCALLQNKEDYCKDNKIIISQFLLTCELKTVRFEFHLFEIYILKCKPPQLLFNTL